jgi:hypothetical protein
MKDGTLVAKQALQGSGRQDAAPLIHCNTLYVPSTMGGTNKSMIEAYHIDALKE